ncbi:hypothetical protein NDU88_005390 [Pleurodeles waltl]|uniref:Uncharacterized protein n=1 Tax=Pleurodeles waltl TaxID=8319 RepID=A0AAV7WYM2_PLEWA|nr:hypothetical protein NDU88_005390 [Pleurodeles waltl]
MGPTNPDMFKQPLQGMCLGPSSPRKEASLETTIPTLNDVWKYVDLAQREGVDHPASDLVRSMDGDGNGDSPQVRSVVLNSLATAEEGMALGEKCGTVLSGSGTTLQIPKQSELCLADTNFISGGKSGTVETVEDTDDYTSLS